VTLARTLAASLTALALVGCSAQAEALLLERFFAASRLRDLTALSNVATVVFEPATRGIVTSFDVTRVTATAGSDRGMAKDVWISAAVKLPGGEIVQNNYIITITRGRGETASRDRWMVTAIREKPPGASIPPS
jgi:hypothetical protein